nr:hypothetical protein [uncultured Flavobacterium sp.]
MARPTLTIEVTQNEACDTMTLADTTADYGGGTVTTASVQEVVVVVNNKSTGTYFTYTFTVSSNVITAATASIDGGTAVSILSELSTTAWPFITDVNELDLWATYTDFTQPEFADAVIQIEYTITRTTATAYSYTTSKCEMVTCEICCCISKMFAELDPTCACGSKATQNAINADTMLQVAFAAADMGDVTKAVEALTKAQFYCDCGCGC